MRSTIILAICIATAVAAPDPVITPSAALAPRQDDDPALLGWVDAVNGQYSDRRTCDYPATLSTSAALAQCCAPNTPCTFWQSCSAGTLFANPSTSLFCDQGYCNTALLVKTVGVSTGNSFLGCWATSLGDEVFTIVRDIGGAGLSSGGSMTSGGVSMGGSSSTTETADVTRVTGTATRSSTGAASSTAAAAGAVVGVKSTGVLGLIAMVIGLM